MPPRHGKLELSPWDQPSSPSRPHQLPYEPLFEKKGFDVFVIRMNRDVSRQQLQKGLFRLFKSHVLILHLSVENDLFGNVNASIIVPSRNDIRKLIRLFQKLPFYGRTLEFSEINPNLPVPIPFKRALIHIFEERQRTRMLLIDVMRRFEEKYDLSLGVLDIMKMQDLVERYVEDGTQMVRLLPAALAWQANIVRQGCLEDLRTACCTMHNTSSSNGSGSKMICCYRVSLREFGSQVRKLLRIHGGSLNLSTFVDCFEKEFGALVEDEKSGMFLEHLLSAIPDVKIKQLPYESRSLILDHGSTNNRVGTVRGGGQGNLSRFLVEVQDMLVLERRSAIPFGEFVQSYRTNYDKMCRVADFGCTRLIDLLMLMEKDIHVIGTGVNRIIMLTHSVQVARFESLIKQIRATCSGYRLTSENFSSLHKYTFKNPFSPINFGVCFVEDLLEEVGIVVPVAIRTVLPRVLEPTQIFCGPPSTHSKEDDSGVFSHNIQRSQKVTESEFLTIDVNLALDSDGTSKYADSLDDSYNLKTDATDVDEASLSEVEDQATADDPDPQPQVVISSRLAMRFF